MCALSNFRNRPLHVMNPRSNINRKNEYQRTLVKRGVSLGAVPTLIGGVTIGEYAL